MAACGSVRHFFEKPLTEKPPLPGSFSRWNQIKPVKPRNRSSSTDEILGELLVEDDSISDSSAWATSGSSSFDNRSDDQRNGTKSSHGCDFTNNITDYFSSSVPKASNAYSYSISLKKSCSLSSFSSERLELCTERLGFESSDDVEDEKGHMNVGAQVHRERATPGKRLTSVRSFNDNRRSRSRSAGEFPPPISSLGRDGKPRVCFRYFRQDGRLILKKIRTPSCEHFLHACREDGRLKLQFLPSTDDDFQGDEEAKEDDK